MEVHLSMKALQAQHGKSKPVRHPCNNKGWMSTTSISLGMHCRQSMDAPTRDNTSVSGSHERANCRIVPSEAESLPQPH
eukprot:1159232-Pelagomonas_calceolata.AAC.8